MHPDDAARFVAASVEELRAGLEELPELPIRAVELRDRTRLLIRFESQTSESLPGLSPVGTVPLIGSLRREQFILALGCADFDSQPPTAELLDGEERPLPAERWPHDPQGLGIVQGHHLFGNRKFFCRPGTREFHTHRQHEDHPWDRYREGFTLKGIAIGLLRDLTERWTFR